MTNSAELTQLLQRAREDRDGALGDLLPLMYADLRQIAGAHMRRERADHTLEPTALVNEAYMRIADQSGLDWMDRAQFLGVAAHVMRQILVDHARKKRAEKRGGDRARVTLNEELVGDGLQSLDLIDLHEKLEEFSHKSRRRSRVVELRFFGGMTFEESAHVLGVSSKTVEADWYLARAWLRRELRAGASKGDQGE